MARIVFVDSTGRDLSVQVVTREKTPRPLTGYTAWIRGASDDIARTINIEGLVLDSGVIVWYGFFGTVTDGDLGTRQAATFKLQITIYGPTGKAEPGPEFSYTWRRGAGAGAPPSAAVPPSGPYLLNPFQFPMPVAPDRMRMPPVREFVPLDGGGANVTLLSRPTGMSGIVRNLALIVVPSDTLVGENVLLNIKYDGESSPSFSVPLLSLIGCEWPLITADNLRTRTKAFEITNSPNPIPGLNNSRTWAFNFKLPIPFTNGVEVYLSASGTDSYLIWSNLVYQDAMPACWNRKLRLLADRVVAAPAATANVSKPFTLTTPTNLHSSTDYFVSGDVGKVLSGIVQATGDGVSLPILAFIGPRDVTVDVMDTNYAPLNSTINVSKKLAYPTLFTRPSGEAGWIAMLSLGFTNATDMQGPYEANTHIYLNGELTASYVWSGLEDLFGGAWFFEQYPIAQGEDGGLNGKDATRADHYKVFADYPVGYTNGVALKVPSEKTGTTFYATTFYYRMMP